MTAAAVRELRVGVIGPGAHAQRDLLPPLRLAEGVRIAAISSRDAGKAASLATRWGAKAFDSWQKLAQPDEVDAVFVAAPPRVHYEVARHCLKNGVHVFVDKPPAENPEQLHDLVAAEREATSLRAFVGFNFPHGTSYQHFRAVLRQSGELSRFHVRFVSKHPREAIWNCRDVREALLLSAGVHPIHLVVQELGAPSEVIARESRSKGAGLGIHLLLTWPEAKVATVELGNHSNRFEFRCEAVTTSGASGVLDQHNRMRFSGLEGQRALRDVGRGAEVVDYEWPSRRGGYDRTGYQGMVEAFRDSIQSEEKSPSSFADCIPVYEVLEQALLQLRARA